MKLLWRGRHSLIGLTAIASAISAPSIARSADGASIFGHVTRVIDGDTLVLESTKIRLWGIDAPEMSTAYGPLARAALDRLIGSKRLRCQLVGGPSYDRLVAICATASNEDLGKMMVQSGWAIDWPYYSHRYYYRDQAQAIRRRVGMYVYAVEPWR